MLRKPTYIQEINYLKLEVEKKFERSILASSDCITLANEIYRKTNNRVSFNTIRRCFNIMKSNYQPSLHTLDSLAIYCGYASFGSFVTSNKKQARKKSLSQSDPLLKFVTQLFDEVKSQGTNDPTYLEFTRLTISHIIEHKNLVNELQKQLAKTYNGQVFYYESFINIDKLNSFYGEGLKFYLSEKKLKEGQVFGLSLFCFRGWLNNDQKELEEFYFKMAAISLDRSADPIVWGRYFSASLYYYEMRGYSKSQILIQSRNYFDSLVLKNLPIGFQPCFEIILAEALLLTGEFEEALFYINVAKGKIISSVPDYILWHNAEVIKLLSAWVLMEKNMMNKSKEILKTISVENFFFLSKRYYNILYLLVKYNSNNRTKRPKEWSSLIRETGFINLHNYTSRKNQSNALLSSLGNNGQ